MLVKWLERSAGLLLIIVGAILYFWKKNLTLALIFAGVGFTIVVITFIPRSKRVISL